VTFEAKPVKDEGDHGCLDLEKVFVGDTADSEGIADALAVN
jgi:hypothetical protein